MADEQNVVHSYLIGLGRGRNGFFCPESRFHLMGGVKPQAEWPAAAPLTQAVIVGLRAGSLRDIRRNIPAELLLSKRELRERAVKAATQEADDEDFIMDDDQTGGNDGNTGNPDDTNTGGNDDGAGNDDGNDDDKEDGNAPDGDKLTEEQIDASSKKDLLAFIKKNEIDMEVLDLNSRSNEAEIKDALKINFGYKTV